MAEKWAVAFEYDLPKGQCVLAMQGEMREKAKWRCLIPRRKRRNGSNQVAKLMLTYLKLII
jgi:hypothetical protein